MRGWMGSIAAQDEYTPVDDPWAAQDEQRRANEPYRGVSLDPGLRRAPGDTAMRPAAQTFADVVGPMVIPQSPSDVALYALGGPLSRAAKIGALAAGFALDSDEAEAGGGNLVKRGIRAFHGSPHNFDKFDIKKIGTGEGAQAYGHGLYFAENPAVAESYDTAAKWSYGRRKPQTIYDQLNDPSAERFLRTNDDWSKLNAQRGFWERVVLGRSPRHIIHDAKVNPDQYGQNELDYIMSLKPDAFKRKGGNMYEVNINADPSQLLDWHAPISEQPKAVLDAMHPDFRKMRAAIDAGAKPSRAARDYAFNPMYGSVDQGSTIYQSLADRSRHGDREASRVLLDAGVPGIKFWDQGSRDVVGGTRNYVTFGDNLIDIVRKYGLAGATAVPVGMGAIAAQDDY